VAAVVARDERVSLDVAEPDAAPAMTSDRRKIAKIIGALVNNAFKFTHEGKVRVSLQLLPERVVYTVEDTGIGIPDDAQRFVFEEFRQVDGTMTRRYGGSGLGLTLARRLARLLGGEIILTSTPGRGSTFRVELPLTFDPHAAPVAE
jgi:signal transduction histidine kinase